MANFRFSGRDPRDLPVEAGDGAIVGKFPICGWMSLNNSSILEIELSHLMGTVLALFQ